MTDYLILRDGVQAFPADPDADAALAAVEAGRHDETTIGAGILACADRPVTVTSVSDLQKREPR